MNFFKKKWVKVIGIIILIPVILGIISNAIYGYIPWFKSRDKTEITFKLDGWITIGSVKNSDLPNLNLMLDTQKVDNIMKVSFRLINSGDKGIEKFESGPTFVIPSEMKIYTAKISEKSKELKVCNNIKLINNSVLIDSLGIFNSSDFIKIDFYLINVKEQEITNNSFDNWELQAKSLDLKIKKEVLATDEKYKKYDKMDTFNTIIMIITIASIIILFYYNIKNLFSKNKFDYKFKDSLVEDFGKYKSEFKTNDKIGTDIVNNNTESNFKKEKKNGK